MQRGRNLGFWNVGVFVASDSEYAFQRAQGILRGLYTGQGSYTEPLRMIDLSSAPPEVPEALEYMRLPRLLSREKHPLSSEFFGLGTPLATDELAVMMSLPHREVPGLKLAATADFNLNPPPFEGFRLGTLLYRAIVNGDYNLIMGITIFSIFTITTIVLIVDLLYPLFDPRIRYS